MRKKANLIVILILMTFIFLFGTHNVNAVPNPGAINWGGSPTAFVTSLYVGVLGRSPESSAVVSNWAAHVNSNPRSRLRVFWGFINSPEYQRSSWARQRREYKLYQRYNSRANTYTYSVSKGPLGAEWRVVYGPTTFGIAMSYRGYYTTYVMRR